MVCRVFLSNNGQYNPRSSVFQNYDLVLQSVLITSESKVRSIYVLYMNIVNHMIYAKL